MPKHLSISLLLALFLFFPLFWISQYNYPSGDDFAMTLTARQMGAVGATWWWYFNFCGRYSYSFLQSLISSFDSWMTIYKLLPPALMLAGFGCLHSFVRAFFGREFGGAELLTLSVLQYVLLISLTPDVATAFYWLATNIQYAGAVFTSLLIFALLIDIGRAKSAGAQTAYALLITTLIALLAGLNEASVLFFMAALGLVNLFYAARFRGPHKWGLAFLSLTVALALVSFLAPGTHARIRATEADVHAFSILAGSVAVTFYILIELLTSTPLLPASIIYFAFLHANRDKLNRVRSLLLGVRWYWVLLFILLTTTAVNSAVFMAIGVNTLTDRLKNIYVYSIFFGWLIMITALFIDLSAKKVDLQVPRWALGTLGASVLGFLLTGYEMTASSKNVLPSPSRVRRVFSAIETRSVYANAYLDILSGRAQRFARQNQEREDRIISAVGDAVEFPLYSYAPQTIFIQDANHPFGLPAALSIVIGGEGKKNLHYEETGPPEPPKEKF